MTTKTTAVDLEAEFPELTSGIDTAVTSESNRLRDGENNAQALSDCFSACFGGKWWQRVEEKSETGAAIQAGKKRLYAGLKRIGHTNPSMAWGRVLEKAGKPHVEKVESVKTLDQQVVEAITTTLKRIQKAEFPSPNAVDTTAHLAAVLKIYGIESDTAE